MTPCDDFRDKLTLDRGLCKIKPDESEKTVIYSGVATYINVQSDWIYFVNSQASNEGIGGAIYKIKTDGSELTLINSLDTYVEDLIVNGNWMYYLSSAEIDWHTYLGASKIFRMRTDGSGRQKLTDDRCENMQVSNNWVFYTSSNNLYKMSVTGDAKSTLINDGSAGKFIADGSVIYYLNINDGNKIYKMYISGENNTKVTENSSRDFNISNGYIYFNNNDDWGALNRVDTNGGGKVRLNKEATFGITIIGNMIYYCIIQVDNYSTNSPIVRMPIDASKPRELFN